MDLSRIINLIKRVHGNIGGYNLAPYGFEVWWNNGELKIQKDTIEFIIMGRVNKVKYDPLSLKISDGPFNTSLADFFVWFEKVLKNPSCKETLEPVDPQTWIHSILGTFDFQVKILNGKWNYFLKEVHIAKISPRCIKMASSVKYFETDIEPACTFLIMDGWVASGMDVPLEEWFRPWYSQFVGTPTPSFSSMYFMAPPVNNQPALEARKKAVRVSFQNILKLIDDQASNGMFSLETSVDSQVADLLRQQGFRVTPSSVEW